MSGLLKYADVMRIHVDSISLGQGQVGGAALTRRCHSLWCSRLFTPDCEEPQSLLDVVLTL